MENQRKLDKLSKLAGLLLDNTITPTQAKQLVELLVNLNTKQKEDMVKTFGEMSDSFTQEAYTKLQEAVSMVSQKHSDALLEVRQLTNKQRKEHEARLEELQSLLVEIKSVKVENGKDADEELIVEKVLERIEIPEYKETILDDGKQIADKLNILEEVIDQKVIKGLTKKITDLSSNIAHNVIKGSSTTLVNGKLTKNINFSGSASVSFNGDNANVTVTGSSGGGTWGTITGTLSDQTDLQLALDAKQDDITLTTTGSSGPATFIGNTLNIPNYAGPVVDGSGTTNEITYWVDSDTIGSLTTATYPSLTELSYVKGVTSSIQTQLNGKQATLVSGTNIKTINSTSLLGSGDIAIPVVTFGTSNQIPFMNTGGTNFDYSANLTWDDNNLLVKSASTSMVSIQTTGAAEQSQLRLQTDSGTVDLRLGGSASGFSDYWFMYDPNNATVPMSISSHASGRVLALGYGQTVGTQANSALNIASTSVVFNESGLDMDLRMESDTHTDAFFLDGANGEITLGAYGAGSITGTATYNLAVDSSGKIIEVATGGGSGITRSVSSISTPTTLGATASTDYTYFVSGTTTVTLPTAVGNTNRYTIVHTDTSTMTIATTSAQTIAFYPAAPATTATVTVQGTVVELFSDGANWWTI